MKPTTSRQRLDHYLARQHPEISRGFLQKLIADGQVLVNGQVEKSGYRLHDSDKVKLLYDMAKIGKIPPIELPILYEDENMLVIDKPAGVLSHALTKFHNEPSVASFLRQHLAKSLDGPEDLRFGIVHRLDRLTSGIMVCAKNHSTMQFLQKQFADRRIAKLYVAVVKGTPKLAEAIIDWPLERNPKEPARFRVGPNGKEAQTAYKILESNQKHSLIELKPLTGRTHQLRVHLQNLGHPIVGDQLYGGETADRLYLHARSLRLTMPSGKAKTFKASLPPGFSKLVTNTS